MDILLEKNVFCQEDFYVKLSAMMSGDSDSKLLVIEDSKNITGHTLINKVCLDWANGRLDEALPTNTADNCDPQREHLSVLCRINVDNFDVEDPLDILLKIAPDNVITPDVKVGLKEYVAKHSLNVCFILDGFTLVDDAAQKKLLDKFKDYPIIVVKCDNINQNNSSNTVYIPEFDDEQQKKYVTTYFNNAADNGKDVQFALLTKQPHASLTKTMVSNPDTLILLCFLLDHSILVTCEADTNNMCMGTYKQLQQSKTKSIQSIMLLLLKHNAERVGCKNIKSLDATSIESVLDIKKHRKDIYNHMTLLGNQTLTNVPVYIDVREWNSAKESDDEFKLIGHGYGTFKDISDFLSACHIVYNNQESKYGHLSKFKEKGFAVYCCGLSTDDNASHILNVLLTNQTIDFDWITYLQEAYSTAHNKKVVFGNLAESLLNRDHLDVNIDCHSTWAFQGLLQLVIHLHKMQDKSHNTKDNTTSRNHGLLYPSKVTLTVRSSCRGTTPELDEDEKTDINYACNKRITSTLLGIVGRLYAFQGALENFHFEAKGENDIYSITIKFGKCFDASVISNTLLPVKYMSANIQLDPRDKIQNGDTESGIDDEINLPASIHCLNIRFTGQNTKQLKLISGKSTIDNVKLKSEKSKPEKSKQEEPKLRSIVLSHSENKLISCIPSNLSKYMSLRHIGLCVQGCSDIELAELTKCVETNHKLRSLILFIEKNNFSDITADFVKNMLKHLDMVLVIWYTNDTIMQDDLKEKFCCLIPDCHVLRVKYQDQSSESPGLEHNKIVHDAFCKENRKGNNQGNRKYRLIQIVLDIVSHMNSNKVLTTLCCKEKGLIDQLKDIDNSNLTFS